VDLFSRQEIVWKGESAKIQDKGIKQEEEWKLLEQNYDIRLKASEKQAEQDAWVIELSPKSPGKSRRTLWVDQSHNVILRSEQFNPDGTRRFNRGFLKNPIRSNFPEEEFSFEPPQGTQN